MLRVYAIITYNPKKESNTTVLMGDLAFKSLPAYPVFPPFRSLYGTVGIRSEDLQYLRSTSYLFLC